MILSLYRTLLALLCIRYAQTMTWLSVVTFSTLPSIEHGLCVLIKDIGRRLPLQLQCIYQGQQGDVRQSVRGNYETRF